MTRLEEIKERCEKIPEPPWEVMGDSVFGEYSYVRKERTPWPITERRSGPDHFVINQFIAHSREDIPWLVSQLEKAIEIIRFCSKSDYSIATQELEDLYAEAREFLEQLK